MNTPSIAKTLLAALLLGCAALHAETAVAQQATESAAAAQNAPTAETVTIDTTVPLSVGTLMKHADLLTGKEVTVDGLVTGVCHSGGKKAFIKDADPKSKRTLRVERTGAAKTFQQENKGDMIRVKGVVRSFKIDAAYLDDWEARSKAAAAEAAKAKSDGHTHGDKEDCGHDCDDEKATPAALKRIEAYRAMLAKSKRPHLLVLWLDGTSWEKTEHKE